MEQNRKTWKNSSKFWRRPKQTRKCSFKKSKFPQKSLNFDWKLKWNRINYSPLVPFSPTDATSDRRKRRALQMWTWCSPPSSGSPPISPRQSPFLRTPTDSRTVIHTYSNGPLIFFLINFILNFFSKNFLICYVK